MPVQRAKCPSQGLRDFFAFDRTDQTSVYFPKARPYYARKQACTVLHTQMTATRGKYLWID